MKINLLLFILLFYSGFSGFSQQGPPRGGRRGHGHVKGNGHVRHQGPRGRTRVRVVYPRYSRSRLVVVRPRRMHTVSVFPGGFVTLRHRRANYYFNNGFYYQGNPGAYAMIHAPIGIRIGVLPVGYHRIMVGPQVNYYYMGTFYREADNQYEAVEPTVGAVVPDLPEHNVEEVTIDGKTFYEYDHILYKSIVTEDGLKYEVVGKLDD